MTTLATRIARLEPLAFEAIWEATLRWAQANPDPALEQLSDGDLENIAYAGLTPEQIATVDRIADRVLEQSQ